MKSLTLDDLHFELRGSDRRKSLQITVERNGELILSVPADFETSAAADFVRDKRSWIYQKLAEKEALRPVILAKEYLSGEGFHYLGRSYRLLLVRKQHAPVKLEDGRFKMLGSAAADGTRHMVHWYQEHGQPWLEKRVELYAGRVGVRPGGVIVRDLGYRWGSSGKGRNLYFHWKTVLLPPPMIDYIIGHELVHLQEPRHTAAFWRRVERAMPDFATRKRWLAENGQKLTSM